LCRDLNTPLDPSEIESAMNKLQQNSSSSKVNDTIELFEFKNWWLGKIVFQDGVGKKLTQVSSTGKNRLLQAKLARKQAEADAQLLANRIALLQQEEAKAWKKIQQTKVRATEILQTREDHERREQSKAEYRFQESEITRKAQETRFVQKQREKAKRQKSQAALIKDKQNQVRSVRQERRNNEIEMQRQKQADQERSKYNREVVRAHEENLRMKKQQDAAEKERHNQRVYDSRVNQEQKRTGSKENEVQMMERQEMELIQRLQNAQMLQKEAYEHLESALSGQAV